MVLPAAAAVGRFAVPLLASAIPSIVDGLMRTQSPEEAEQALRPQWEEIISRLIGGGMSRQQAEAAADEEIQAELQKQQQSGGEGMNPWLTAGLSIAALLGGVKLGNKLFPSAKAAAPAAEPTRALSKVSASGSSNPSAVGDLGDDVVREATPAPLSLFPRRLTSGKRTIDVDAEVMPPRGLPGPSGEIPGPYPRRLGYSGA